ncbi:hypothetical protein FA15DRAFT_754654 [Coprinopsis marcescibilis]|uniref:Uncharacterized protein n=1 Tax=Coprinopsis marcescibilis TaxID=230819 RepID=A0A5C3L4A4_COPMA|nr:hypothetical protein FA15DRAFT_754654 [Coprinopsis marcescibilis]
MSRKSLEEEEEEEEEGNKTTLHGKNCKSEALRLYLEASLELKETEMPTAQIDHTWPSYILQSFQSAGQLESSNHSLSVYSYFGAYIRLLYHLFGLDGPFEVTVQHQQDVVNLVITYLKGSVNYPILFLQINPREWFLLESKRRQSDNLIRSAFRDIRESSLLTPAITGISVFGTRLALYKYDKSTNCDTPPAIVPHREYLNDLAPTEWWDCDINDVSGRQLLLQEVENARRFEGN